MRTQAGELIRGDDGVNTWEDRGNRFSMADLTFFQQASADPVTGAWRASKDQQGEEYGCEGTYLCDMRDWNIDLKKRTLVLLMEMMKGEEGEN